MSMMNEVMSPRAVNWRLMLLTDRHQAKIDFLDLIAEVCEAGIGAIQLRAKDLSEKDYLALVERVLRITRKKGIPLIVNHRVAVALSIEAEGVNLGGRSMPIDAVRRLVGEDMIIGATAHNVEEARVAGQAGADYLTFGPTFDAPNKPGAASLTGLDPIMDLKNVTDVPVFAVGGITRSNLPQVIQAGFDGVACIQEIMTSEKPGQVVSEMRAIIEELSSRS